MLRIDAPEASLITQYNRQTQQVEKIEYNTNFVELLDEIYRRIIQAAHKGNDNVVLDISKIPSDERLDIQESLKSREYIVADEQRGCVSVNWDAANKAEVYTEIEIVESSEDDSLPGERW